MSKGVICFDISKNERFQLSDNYKMLHRKLKVNWKVEQSDGELKKERLQRVGIFVLAGPQDRFTEEEFQVLKEFVEKGGKLWVLLGEGGEQEFNTNVNFFLEQYGIYINSDTVVRPHYYKNFHPKECIIGGGVVCESMWRHLIKQDIEVVDYDFSDEKYKIHFQYPYGATLNVSEPANVLLSTGPVVYPFNRPLAGYYVNEHGGKILAIGSGYMWHDKYLQSDKTNDALLEYFIQLLGGNEIQYSHLDFNDVEINDNKTFTDIAFIADLPKACLIDSIGGTETPADFKQMFDMTIYSLSNRLLKDVMTTYEQLNVKYEPLKIIKPQFEIPLPPLQLATFPPIFSEPAAPPLELFDLDEVFSAARTQLANMTSKCVQSITAKDASKPLNTRELENYIKECARITGIIHEHQDVQAREILNILARQIVSYRPYADE
ncbi:intraflagellar transport protein 52 homolog [Bactrocera dorsalis]|uniref:Intraflagellar transport protein 52 homolog n=2 Tax=Bactrocera dorsalis TaxID=27457 RepID=A0A8N4LA11_BACDO|nr:intraflagellar transport protein 52 homolog [Bactrocera dorsalis]XP_049316663.1 intraflagellar transport protein 52 homolog [Bactrocera dorsalis]